MKVQNDRMKHQELLQTVKEDEDRLRRDIAAEVRVEIEKAKERKSGRAWKAIPLFPSLLKIIGLFVSFPPESVSLVASCFSGSAVVKSVSELFSRN